MNYQESIEYIESLAPTQGFPLLERMACFMQEHGLVQDQYPCIHVAGTNGKGSVVAMLDAIFRVAGLRVGRFIGPHLLRWNERIHVNGQAISNEEFAELTTRVSKMSRDFGLAHPEFGQLSWFELITAMAFFCFLEHQVDLAIFEVGLGGRFDSTNVLSRPLVSVITTIALDHMHILGDTISQIAFEKSGIIKSGVPVVTSAYGEALAEIQRIADQHSSPLIHCLPPDMAIPGSTAWERRLPAGSYPGTGGRKSASSLLGPHQELNGLAAITAAYIASPALEVNLTTDTINQALSSVYWPGRLQYLRDLNLVLDGAHNPSGACAFALVGAPFAQSDGVSDQGGAAFQARRCGRQRALPPGEIGPDHAVNACSQEQAPESAETAYDERRESCTSVVSLK